MEIIAVLSLLVGAIGVFYAIKTYYKTHSNTNSNPNNETNNNANNETNNNTNNTFLCKRDSLVDSLEKVKEVCQSISITSTPIKDHPEVIEYSENKKLFKMELATDKDTLGKINDYFSAIEYDFNSPPGGKSYSAQNNPNISHIDDLNNRADDRTIAIDNFIRLLNKL